MALQYQSNYDKTQDAMDFREMQYLMHNIKFGCFLCVVFQIQFCPK